MGKVWEFDTTKLSKIQNYQITIKFIFSYFLKTYKGGWGSTAAWHKDEISSKFSLHSLERSQSDTLQVKMKKNTNISENHLKNLSYTTLKIYLDKVSERQYFFCRILSRRKWFYIFKLWRKNRILRWPHGRRYRHLSGIESKFFIQSSLQNID